MDAIWYLSWSAAHLFSLALMLACAFGMGNLFLGKFRFHNVPERMVFTTSIGFGLCSIVLFVLGLLRILYQPVIWTLTAAGAITTGLCFAYSVFGRQTSKKGPTRNLTPRPRNNFSTRRRLVVGLLIILTLGYWIVSLISAQYPPILWDAIMQHLVVAREFLAQHGPVVLLGIAQPVLPALNHMLFTWALALQDDILAQMVEQAFSILTAVGIYAWGKRQAQGALGYAAAALWLAHPLVRLLSKTAYVDIAITCFVFLGIYALRIFWDHRDVRWWYLGMALLAMGAGVKLPGLFFLGIATLFGLWLMMRSYIGSLRRGRAKEDYEYGLEEHRFTWKPLILGGTLALLILIPWYGFIGYSTGNPLWPALAQYSRGMWGAPWVVSGVNALSQSGVPQTLGNFLTLPIDWLRYPENYNAELHQSLFPLIVIWPLAWIVAVFNRSVRWWTLWALAYTVFWFFQAPLLRYWLPVLPIAGLALCESIQWVLERIWIPATFRRAAWVSVGALILVWSGLGAYREIKEQGVPPTTPAAREDRLSILGGYMGVKYVNAHAKNDDAVCVLSASWLNYYFNQRVIDLRGALFQNRKPTFRWPDDQEWMEWLESENANWIFIYYKAPELSIPKQNPVLNPFWPDYELIYADTQTWVFHRE